MSAAASSNLSVAVNDAATHYSIQALVKADGPETFSVMTDGIGKLDRALAPGEYHLEVSAPGYEGMRSTATIESGRSTPMIFMLNPLNPPAEQNLLESKLRTGFTLIHGYATDERGRPIRDARVRLQKANTETMTDERGYYWLSVPMPPQATSGAPGTDNLIAEKPGYKTIIHRNIAMVGEDAMVASDLP
jgi:hypothetical protein